MTIHEEHIKVSRSARYYVAGDPSDHIRQVWMLFHGYGELAREFLGDCLPLLRQGILLVAPEGLSRFYHRSGRGRVGASWMTREDRLREIDDYIGWINAVWQRVTEDLDAVPSLSILGFSQGGATAMRWGLRGIPVPEQIVLWGAGFPSEELKEYAGRLVQTKVTVVSGKADRIVAMKTIAETADAIHAIGGNCRHLTHENGHEIDSELLLQL